jgi:adenine/guanine phosphoribosyltransferase-like PRPP-binding protein
MRLRTIREGIFFGNTTGLDPAGIEAARKKAATGKGQHGGARGSGGLVDLFMNRPYQYRDEDSPEDLVHLNPLNSVTQLPVLPDSPYARASFRGAKIYYAFSVVPRESYRGPEVESQFPSINISKDDAERVQKMLGKIFDDAGQFTRKDLRGIIKTMDKNYLGDPEFQEHWPALQELKTLLPSYLDAMTKLKVGRVAGLTRALLRDAELDRGKFSGEILDYAKESLAKKIKNPTAAGEQEMSRQVLERAVNNFVRLFPQPFDFIVAPESSSDFNGKLIGLLKARGGAGTPVVTLNKLLGRDVAIDFRSLYERAWQYHDEAVQTGKYLKNMVFTPERIAKAQQETRTMDAKTLPAVDPGESLTPLDPRWADYWVQSKIGFLDAGLGPYQDKKPPIKALQMDDYKQYMQLYSGEGLDDVKGKRVLIVDDNVDNSSTMQMLHALVKERGAGEVVIFSPFYMG